MKKTTPIVFWFVIFMAFSIFATPSVYAESETTTETTEETPDDRIQKHLSTLGMQIPEITDNPSLPITFTPVKEETIELQIDGAGYNAIRSPYTFSSLAIGKHALDFRYKDSSGITQTFSLDLVVIPRIARLGTQQLWFKAEDKVILSGSALPNSSVDLWILGNNEIIVRKTDVNTEGDWTIDLTDTLTCGDYKISIVVKKDGLASDSTTPVNISYCSDTQPTEDSGNNDQTFSFRDWWNSIVDKIKGDGSIVIIGICVFLVGIVLGLIYNRLAIAKLKRQTRSFIVDKLRNPEGSPTPQKPTYKAHKKESKKQTEHTATSATATSQTTKVELKESINKQAKDTNEESDVSDSTNDKPEPDVAKLISEQQTHDQEIKGQKQEPKAKNKKKPKVDTSNNVTSKISSFFDRFKKQSVPTEPKTIHSKEKSNTKKRASESEKSSTLSREEFLSKFQNLEQTKRKSKPNVTLVDDSDNETN